MKCIKPIYVEMRDKKIPVPCGHCAWCMKRRRDEWFFRLKVEKTQHKFARFLTLTYADEFVPYHVDEDTGMVVLDVSKKDIQKFVHDIRDDGYKVRYMINSEYGKKGTERPHYHGVLFSDEKISYGDYWSKGFVVDKPARDGSFKYICKYMLKGSNVPEGSAPIFSLMSRRPGIGYSFIYKGEPYILDRGGVRVIPGRYYKRKYQESLDAKFRDFQGELKAEYLSQTDPHAFFRSVHQQSAPQMDFEIWLRDVYLQDFKKQIKINNK